MPRGHVPLRVAGLLGGGGDDVEADEGEEDDRRGGEDAAPAEVRRGEPEQHLDQRGGSAARRCRACGRRDERVVVGGLDEEEPDARSPAATTATLIDDHDAGDPGRQLDADDQHAGQRPATMNIGGMSKPGRLARDRRRAAAGRQVAEQRAAGSPTSRPATTAAPSASSRHQVPADDPGDELAEGGVGEGVGRAGHRHGGGELGVAERGQRRRRRRRRRRTARPPGRRCLAAAPVSTKMPVPMITPTPKTVRSTRTGLLERVLGFLGVLDCSTFVVRKRVLLRVRSHAASSST